MKKLSLALALIFALTAFAGCNNEEPASTTTNGGTTTSAATTTTSTTTTTKPSAPDSDEPSAPTSEEEDEDQLDIMELAGGKSGDLQLEGYEANGYWIEEDGKMVCDYGNPPNGSLFVVTNDRMSAGTLEATYTTLAGSDQNDNGIVFGIEENLGEESYYNYFWESPDITPAYYFLFSSDAGTLYLAKVAYGVAWTVIDSGSSIEGYTHGCTITIKVEFDGQGHIQCYANDLLMIDYQDPNPLTGDRYGIRAEVAGVAYESVIATHD
ncbi:MAG: hypothetical protein ACI3XR_03050 [Eubacteriales bacterium]